MLVSECCIVMLLEEDLLDLGTEPNCSVLSEMIPYEYHFVSNPKSHVGWGGWVWWGQRRAERSEPVIPLRRRSDLRLLYTEVCLAACPAPQP